MSKLNLIAAIALSLFVGKSGFARDVEVFLVGSNLMITDSSEFNDRSFDSTRIGIGEFNGELLIMGFNGTRINGQAAIYEPFPTGDVVVQITAVQAGSQVTLVGLDLSGRSDDLRVTVNGNVNMYDCFAFTSLHSDIAIYAHHIKVDGGGCERDLRLSASWYTNSDVEVTNTVVNDDLTIKGNDRHNEVEVMSCWIADVVDIKLKGGNDELLVEDLNTESLIVDLGSGQDALFIDDTHPSDEWFAGGSGSDVVYQSQRIVHRGNSTGIETIGK